MALNVSNAFGEIGGVLISESKLNFFGQDSLTDLFAKSNGFFQILLVWVANSQSRRHRRLKQSAAMMSPSVMFERRTLRVDKPAR